MEVRFDLEELRAEVRRIRSRNKVLMNENRKLGSDLVRAQGVVKDLAEQRKKDIRERDEAVAALWNLHEWGRTFFHGHQKAMTEAGKLLKRLDAGEGG